MKEKTYLDIERSEKNVIIKRNQKDLDRLEGRIKSYRLKVSQLEKEIHYMADKDIVWEAFHETIPRLEKRTKELEKALRKIDECGCTCFSVGDIIGKVLYGDLKAQEKATKGD